MVRGLYRILMVMLVVSFLAACSNGERSQPTATTAPTTTSMAASTPFPSPTPSTASTTTPRPMASATTAAASPTRNTTATIAATTVTTPIPTPAPATPTALPVTITDATGKQVTVQDVSRIVPVNGDIAEIVWSLGLGDRIVGVDTSATYPPDLLKKLPHIGYQRALSAEGILSLKPTVVIGTPLAGPAQVLDQVRAAGIPVVIVENPTSIDAPMVKIRQVARALGVPDRGEALARQVEQEIKDAQALAARATSHPRAVYLHSPGSAHEPQVAGTNTAAHVMIEAAGAIDAAAAAGIQGYKTLTAEAMTAAAPDYILIFTTDLEATGGIDGLLQLPGIAQTPAGQHRAVLAYDGQFLLGMGPRTGQALRTLVLALHPELGKQS